MVLDTSRHCPMSQNCTNKTLFCWRCTTTCSQQPCLHIPVLQNQPCACRLKPHLVPSLRHTVACCRQLHQVVALVLDGHVTQPCNTRSGSKLRQQLLQVRLSSSHSSLAGKHLDGTRQARATAGKLMHPSNQGETVGFVPQPDDETHNIMKRGRQ